MSKKILIGIAVLLIAVTAALVYFNQEPSLDSRVADVNRTLAIAIDLFNQKKYEETVDVLKKIKVNYNKDWRIPYYRASALVKLKDFPSAADYLQEALQLNNNDTRILYALGVVYFKLGKLELAEGYFASTLEIDPTHDDAKGLMDIMARLQRPLPVEDSSEDETDSNKESEKQ